MPKQVTISPAEMRAKSTVKFAPIPVNQYDRTVKDELAAGNVSKDDLLRIQRDMVIIRTFENMLDSVKKQGHYRDIKYNHRGPAHLSIGQEAAAVGQAFLLGIDDHIYGSHRSHGEILAKGLSAIQKLDDQSLMNIMRGYFDGDCLRVVEKDAAGDVKDLAIDYLVYGALAEIFAERPASTRAWAARCTPSFRRSGSIRTTPSSAVRATFPSARRSSSTSTRSPASSSATSATRPPAAVPLGKPCALRPWISSRNCGRKAIAAVCPSS